MKMIYKWYIESIKNILDKELLFVALVIVLTISYYINPLVNVDLSSWNRTFSNALLLGISIDSRIKNFYCLFVFILPILFVVTIVLLLKLVNVRKQYKDYYVKYSFFSLFSVLAALFSRFSSESTIIANNVLINHIIAFWVILVVVSLIDNEEVITFSEIVMALISFTTFSALGMIILKKSRDSFCALILAGLLVICLAVIVIKTTKKDCYNRFVKSTIYLLMWLPAIARITLEVIYYMTEHEHIIKHYYSIICSSMLLFSVVSVIFAIWTSPKRMDLTNMGYIGAITSFGCLSFFSFDYQYTWSFGNYSNLYELGNSSVAVDTLLHGKLPIIDYFSAHALKDVWTRILYCIIHKDVNGILIDPYYGIAVIIEMIILFYIVKYIFDENVAALYVILFPGLIVSIKWTSICFLSILVLLIINKDLKVKNCIVFWIMLLLSAFMTYDEGISLGLSCIFAFALFLAIDKQWKKMLYWFLCGVCVGSITLIMYITYSIKTGLAVFQRIKEWLSVSVGSNSTWATASFGDQSSFGFFLAYFVAPVLAIAILIFVIYKYIKAREKRTVTILIVAFSMAEIIYIPRTIVFHNLAVSSGLTGVLFNFFHWSFSLFVLYFIEKKGSQNEKLIMWMTSMFLVFVIEGAIVTNQLPSTNSVLVSKSLSAVKEFQISDIEKNNPGGERVILDEESAELVKKFKNLFDVLLSDDQTFMDFANVTSMYLLTNRQRPSYVAQTPSLLTDLYSQECYLKQIENADCPLVIVGMTETPHLNEMFWVPHNIRYYKVAEYIYKNYRPLVSFDEFAIWCKIEKHDRYRDILDNNDFQERGYTYIDYGYDFTDVAMDDQTQVAYKPYHSFDLKKLPYIWANYDKYEARNNKIILDIDGGRKNVYLFDGSQSVKKEKGNYVWFEIENYSNEECSTCIDFMDSACEGARFQYKLDILPGTHGYMIRVSEDYFWDIYNINTITLSNEEALTIKSIKVLEGD